MDSALIAEFVERLGIVSVQSLVLIGVIAAVCRLWPSWPATVRCWLWWLVSAQLVIGLLWPAPFELAWWPSQAEVAAPLASATPQVTGVDMTRVARDVAIATTPATSMQMPAPSDSAPFPWFTLLAWLWMTGVVMTALQTLQEWQRARRWRAGARECVDARVLALYRHVGRELGLERLPSLQVSDDIASPQLLGPRRAVVLLPADVLERLEEAELRMALHHELGHFHRRDLWWGWMPAIARHLFFFHPGAHLVVREYAIAREAACDETVLATTQHTAHDYGRLLLRLGVAPRPCAGLASASPTYTLLKRRLVMLQNTGVKPHFVPLAIVVGLVILAALPYRVVASVEHSVAPAVGAASRPVASTGASADAQPAARPNVSPQTRTAVAAAPASAATPKAGTSTFTQRSDGDDYAYILMEGDHTTANAESEDFKAMARLRGDDKSPLLWVRQDKRAYVIRDAATIERAHALWKPMQVLGEQQAALGEQQAALGKKQAALGQQMAGLGSKMADIGRQHADMAVRHVSLAMDDTAAANRERAELDRKAASLDQQQQALDRQQAGLDEQQSGLGSQQAVLGEKQAVLGDQQAKASDRAHREMQRLIDGAIRNGLAQPASR